jgi:deazaflavin-dependent oxidoreductase (nitroreductase family)
VVIGALTRRGLGDRHTYVLTVAGRKTGKSHSTPVRLVEIGAGRWLVAPYGEVAWVRNARAAGEVTLARGGRDETFRIEELNPAQAAPVLRDYLKAVAVVRPFFGVRPDSPLADIEREAPHHPVFRLLPRHEPAAGARPPKRLD